MTSSPSREPIEVGRIFATGWGLYRSHFSQYGLIALKASLWLFLPLLLFLPIRVLLTARNIGDYAGLLALLVPALLVVGLLCYAEYLGLATGISRLVYQSLSHADESEREALRFTRSRRYSLLWENVLRGLIFFLAYLVFLIIAVVFIVVAIALSRSNLGGDPSAFFSPAGLIVGLLFAVGTLVFIGFFIWLALRLVLADQPLAIEQDSGTAKAIGRSWTLMKGNVLRSLLLMIMAYIIVLPVVLVSSVIGQLIAYRLFGLAPLPEPGRTIASFAEVLPFLAGAVISAIVSTLGSIITLPLWSTLLTALYFELRRREESGLIDEESVVIDTVE